MKNSTMPKAGDVLTLDKWRHNPDLPRDKWTCKYSWHGVAGNGCTCKDNEHYTVEFTVKEIVYFADNSIEAHGFLADGTRYHMMLDAPHGDACY